MPFKKNTEKTVKEFNTKKEIIPYCSDLLEHNAQLCTPQPKGQLKKLRIRMNNARMIKG